jgi:hypothetical protein
VILMPPAGCENDAFRIPLDETGDCLRAGAGTIEKIQPELEKRLSRFRLSPRMLQQALNLRQA